MPATDVAEWLATADRSSMTDEMLGDIINDVFSFIVDQRSSRMASSLSPSNMEGLSEKSNRVSVRAGRTPADRHQSVRRGLAQPRHRRILTGAWLIADAWPCLAFKEKDSTATQPQSL